MNRKIYIGIVLSLSLSIVFAACKHEDDTPPSIPAPNAPLVIASDKMLTVYWTAVEGVEKYNVYYSVTQTPPAQPQSTVVGTTAVLNGLINRTTYYIWIKAVNKNRSSDFSPYTQGIPWSSYEVPAIPGKPVIVPGIYQLSVTWEECGGASSYEVYYSTSPTPPNTLSVTTNITSAVITNLENDKIYYIWVRAVNNAGKSNYSPVESGIPQSPTVAPATPAIPTLTIGNHELIVSWQAVEFAAAYEVWVGTSDNSTQAEKNGDDITGGATEITITGLTNEITYYVWIIAKNIIGSSDLSLPSNAKPSAFAVLPETPTMPSVIIGYRELTVNWPLIEGSLVYEVYAGTTNNSGNAEKQISDIFGTSITLTGLENGTTYYIWVRAKNDIGTSSFSPAITGTPSVFAATPSAPQSAPAITVGYRELTISWQTVEGANAYEVWTSTTNNFTTALKYGNDVSDLSVVITGLTNGTTYFVWIKAKNNAGTSGFGPATSGIPSAFLVIPQSPSAPTVSIGNGQIVVNWTAVEGALSYEIWQGMSNYPAYAIKIGDEESESLSKTISGLNNGNTYYFWLKAKNNVGTSDFSPAISAKPIGNIAPPTITAANGQLSVSWTIITGADQYEVFYGTGVNPPQIASHTITTTTATITGLTNGTIYNVWVRGKNSTGNGTMSSAVSAKPIANMGLFSVTPGEKQCSLSWSAVAGADQYEIYHNTNNSIPIIPTQTVTSTTATITGLTNGRTYYIWVKPKNAHGAGTASTSTYSLPLVAPGSLTVSAANQQITISWAEASGATSYEVYYSTNATIPTSSSATVTTTNRTFTSLTNGTMYYFWVKSVDADRTSEASPMASGKPIGNMGTVTLSTGVSGELILNWSAIAGADEYEIYHNTSNSIPVNAIQTVSITSAKITGLVNGITYYTWVKPINANGTGTVNTPVSGKPLGTPEAPSLIADEGQIQVTWTAVLGANEYEVYYGTVSAITLWSTTATTTATITGLTNGTIYYVRLRAKNANGISEYGPTASNVPGPYGLYRGSVKIDNYNLSSSITYISAYAVTGDEYNIYLRSDESVSPINLSFSNKTVKITLRGYATITLSSNGSMFTVNNNITLILDENITLVGRDTNNASLVRVNSGGNFIMNNGSISGNTADQGGGVRVESNGVFTMNGGTISGNTATNGGGGILIFGTMTLNNGKINGNEGRGSYGGGGVFVFGGILTMNDGIISDNNAARFGGGIYVYVDSAIFIMYGGVISGNIAREGGGGVFFSNSNYYFKKLPNGNVQNSGIIYGSEITGIDEDGVQLKNIASNNIGHAVSCSSVYRNTTAWEIDQIDSTTGRGLSMNGNAPYGE